MVSSASLSTCFRHPQSMHKFVSLIKQLGYVILYLELLKWLAFNGGRCSNQSVNNLCGLDHASTSRSAAIMSNCSHWKITEWELAGEVYTWLSSYCIKVFMLSNFQNTPRVFNNTQFLHFLLSNYQSTTSSTTFFFFLFISL